MTILDRYLVREFLKALLLMAASLVLLYAIVDLFERTRMFLSNHATLQQMLTYVAFNLPAVVSLTLPASVLLAAMVTFGALARHNEIVAIKANGVSLYRTSVPVVLLAAVLSALLFVFSEYVTPHANAKAEHLVYIEVQKRKTLGTFKQNQIWYRGKNGIYNFRFFDPGTNSLKGISIHYLDPQMNLAKRIDAESAQWKDGQWVFQNLLIATFENPDFPTLERIPSQVVELTETPDDFKIVQRKAETMGYADLKAYIQKIQSEGYDATPYLADLHGKVAVSFVSIILAVIGISFSLRSERSGGVVQHIGVGIVFGFSYWIIHAFALSLGRTATIPPLLSAWTANILFVLLSGFFYLRVRT